MYFDLYLGRFFQYRINEGVHKYHHMVLYELKELVESSPHLGEILGSIIHTTARMNVLLEFGTQ